ncbi:hypothetical protein IWQ62_000084 [Dispira parvispora]|uniref:Uncharacterized protein n=1 Tax=Dispira parvispora TaxID=1520584 RepID=A0A9W8E9L8_9FUNG|nr:hypothetical protein IWQ62_000084 [Dispira parvispora]
MRGFFTRLSSSFTSSEEKRAKKIEKALANSIPESSNNAPYNTISSTVPNPTSANGSSSRTPHIGRRSMLGFATTRLKGGNAAASDSTGLGAPGALSDSKKPTLVPQVTALKREKARPKSIHVLGMGSERILSDTAPPSSLKKPTKTTTGTNETVETATGNLSSGTVSFANTTSTTASKAQPEPTRSKLPTAGSGKALNPKRHSLHVSKLSSKELDQLAELKSADDPPFLRHQSLLPLPVAQRKVKEAQSTTPPSEPSPASSSLLGRRLLRNTLRSRMPPNTPVKTHQPPPRVPRDRASEASTLPLPSKARNRLSLIPSAPGNRPSSKLRQPSSSSTIADAKPKRQSLQPDTLEDNPDVERETVDELPSAATSPIPSAVNRGCSSPLTPEVPLASPKSSVTVDSGKVTTEPSSPLIFGSRPLDALGSASLSNLPRRPSSTSLRSLQQLRPPTHANPHLLAATGLRSQSPTSPHRTGLAHISMLANRQNGLGSSALTGVSETRAKRTAVVSPTLSEPSPAVDSPSGSPPLESPRENTIPVVEEALEIASNETIATVTTSKNKNGSLIADEAPPLGVLDDVHETFREKRASYINQREAGMDQSLSHSTESEVVAGSLFKTPTSPSPPFCVDRGVSPIPLPPLDVGPPVPTTSLPEDLAAIETLQAEVQKLRQRAQEVERELANSRQQHDHLSLLHDTLESELLQVKSELEYAQHSEKQCQVQTRALQAEVERITEEKQRVESELEAQKEEYETLSNLKESIEVDLIQCDEEKSAVEKDNENLRCSLQERSKQYDEVKAAHQQVKTQVNKLRKELDYLRTQPAEADYMEQTITRLESERNQLRQELSTLKQDSVNFADQSLEAVSDNEDVLKLQLALDETQKERDQLQEQLTVLQAQCDHLTTHNRTLTKELGTIQALWENHVSTYPNADTTSVGTTKHSLKSNSSLASSPDSVGLDSFSLSERVGSGERAAPISSSDDEHSDVSGNHSDGSVCWCSPKKTRRQMRRDKAMSYAGPVRSSGDADTIDSTTTCGTPPPTTARLSLDERVVGSLPSTVLPPYTQLIIQTPNGPAIPLSSERSIHGGGTPSLSSTSPMYVTYHMSPSSPSHSHEWRSPTLAAVHSLTPSSKSLACELEQEIQTLKQEKERLQSDYARIPLSGGGPTIKFKKERLEEHMDLVDKALQSAKLRLKLL